MRRSNGQNRKEKCFLLLACLLARFKGRGVQYEWSKIHFGKWRFSPVFDPFLVPKRPIFKAFWDFPWAKTRPNGLTTG